MSGLELIKSEPFGNLDCDFYCNENGDILMTRKQIGQALAYSNPDDAIYRIHNRHKERLNKFSVIVSLSSTDGKHYDTILYTAKGIYEICRYSDQPQANDFYDFIYEVLESIRKHGAYLTPEKIEEALLDPDTIIKLATRLKEERTKNRILSVECDTLQTELDRSKEWYSIKRVAALNGICWKDIKWRQLKKASDSLGLSVKKAFDANFGSVNVYHYKAWELAYPQYEL